jgi:hypothetical protein
MQQQGDVIRLGAPAARNNSRFQLSKIKRKSACFTFLFTNKVDDGNVQRFRYRSRRRLKTGLNDQSARFEVIKVKSQFLRSVGRVERRARGGRRDG